MMGKCNVSRPFWIIAWAHKMAQHGKLKGIENITFI